MKKLWPIAFALAIVLLFVYACTSEKQSNETVIASGTHYVIYEIIDNDEIAYRYEIIGINGDIVKSETTWTYPNIISMFDDAVLSISRGAGTGTFSTQYYDISRDVFSDIFLSPMAEEYGCVVYLDVINDTIKLVVRDIFDKSMLYKEFEIDFSPTANPIDALKHIEFIDKNTLTIKYLSGTEYIEKTAIVRY